MCRCTCDVLIYEFIWWWCWWWGDATSHLISSVGLILLTSDGRVNDAMLNKRDKKEKVYQVEMNKTPSDEQLEEMSRGEGMI